jgi:hypothetical protein
VKDIYTRLVRHCPYLVSGTATETADGHTTRVPAKHEEKFAALIDGRSTSFVHRKRGHPLHPQRDENQNPQPHLIIFPGQRVAPVRRLPNFIRGHLRAPAQHSRPLLPPTCPTPNAFRSAQRRHPRPGDTDQSTVHCARRARPRPTPPWPLLPRAPGVPPPRPSRRATERPPHAPSGWGCPRCRQCPASDSRRRARPRPRRLSVSVAR